MEEKNDDTDPLLLPKKRQRNTQQQSVVTEEQKKINFAQKLQRNAQRKREAWAKARDTQSAKDKARLYSLKSNLHFSGDTTNDATAAQRAISAFPNKALHGIEIVGFDGCAEVSNCSGGLHQEEQSSTTTSISKEEVSTLPKGAAKPRAENNESTKEQIMSGRILSTEFSTPPQKNRSKSAEQPTTNNRMHHSSHRHKQHHSSSAASVTISSVAKNGEPPIDLTVNASIITPEIIDLDDHETVTPPTLEEIFLENDLNSEEILTYNTGAEIRRKDLLTLKPRTWLNDEVINYYMNMLLQREHRPNAVLGSNLQSWFTTSFFFVKLLTGTGEYNYANVRRWTLTVDIFSSDKVFFPINLGNTHWALLVIYLLLKELHYYDSMSCDGTRFLNAALQWLSDELMDKKQMHFDQSEWKCYHSEAEVPQQQNGFDCGMFVIMCARAIAYNKPLTSYHQRDMPRYRTMIGRHILRHSLLDSLNQSIPYMYDLPPSGFVLPQPQHQTGQPAESLLNDPAISPRVTIHMSNPTTTTSSKPSVYSSSSSSSSSTSNFPAYYPSPTLENNTRTHHAIQKKQVSFLTQNIVAYVDIVDSEDSDSDKSLGETKTQHVRSRKVLSNTKSTSKHYLLTNSKDSANNEDSEDSEDSEHSKKDSHSNAFNAFSWLDESKASRRFTSSNTKDFDDFDCENTSIDADIDGTHSHLFLNSESEGDDDEADEDNEEGGNVKESAAEEGADDEGYKIKRRAQIAKSRRKTYWNKKQQVDIVETSYCSNSQEVKIVQTQKYAGYLLLGDHNCIQFPDGIQYRLK